MKRQTGTESHEVDTFHVFYENTLPNCSLKIGHDRREHVEIVQYTDKRCQSKEEKATEWGVDKNRRRKMKTHQLGE